MLNCPVSQNYKKIRTQILYVIISVQKNILIINSFIGDQAYLHVIDNKLAKEYYVNKSNNYVKYEPSKQNLTRILGNGMLFAEGMEWKAKRKIISTVFNYNFVKQLIPTIINISNKKWDSLPQDGKTVIIQYLIILSQHFNIINESQIITAEVIIQSFFGSSTEGVLFYGKPISQALSEIVNELDLQQRSLLYFLFGAYPYKLGIFNKSRKLNKEIDDFMKFGMQIIINRVKQIQSSSNLKSERQDLIEILIESQTLVAEASQKSQGQYDYQELLDEFCTFYVGGMDTTGHLIAASIFILTKEKEECQLIRQEINEIIIGDSDITIENIKKLKRLNNFINEVLRTNGPTSGIFIRRATQDHTLGKYHIKKNTLLKIGIMDMNHNPKYFPEPQKFKPSRWNEVNENQDAFQFIPFSAGQRNCVGQHLALLETKIALISFLKKFQQFQMIQNYDEKWNMGFLYELANPPMVKIVKN